MSTAAHRCTAARACAALDSIAATLSDSDKRPGVPQHQSSLATASLMCCTATAQLRAHGQAGAQMISDGQPVVDEWDLQSQDTVWTLAPPLASSGRRFSPPWNGRPA